MDQELFFCCALFALLVGCRKEDNDPPPANNDGGGNNTGGPGDIYICGSEDIGSANYARYWKNGQEVELNSNGRPSSARTIWVNDDHVFVAGTVREQGTTLSQPCYWVDGDFQELDNDDGSAFCSVEDLFVTNGDELHMVGHVRASSGFDKAMYWGPGSSTALTDGSTDAQAHGVCVEGGSIYVCGYVDNQAIGGERIATYWLNGSPVTLGDGYGDSEANDIRVVNGQVIVVGTEYIDPPGPSNGEDQAVIWVNGARQVLSPNGGAALALHTTGNDVYVGGMANLGAGGPELPTYWVNGNNASSTFEGTILDLFVRDGNIHSVTGDNYTNHGTGATANYGGMYGIHIH